MAKRGGKREGAGRPKGSGRWGEVETKQIRLPENRIGEVMDYLDKKYFASDEVVVEEEYFYSDSSEEDAYSLPFYTDAVQAGSLTDRHDHVGEKLNVNKYLIKNPSSTFYVRVAGNSMNKVGIFAGDLLSVDREIVPKSGEIVIAVVDGALTVKRLVKKSNSVFLQPENDDFDAIEIKEHNDASIWGVVTSVIRKIR